VHRSSEGEPAGRIGPHGRRRLSIKYRPIQYGPIRYAPRLLAAAVPLGALLWFLLTPGLPSGGSGAMFALLTLGGWSLGVLPVHCDPRQTGPARRSPRSAAQPQPAGSGVEAGGLQDPAQD
jgi:hypothetical protein